MKDPVCGMKVRAEEARTSRHAGIAYYFCGEDCASAFEREPQAYLQATDPVCGMRVPRAGAKATARQDGQPYFFCSAACAVAFEQDTSAYLEATDPVCGEKIQRTRADASVRHEGRPWFFCSRECADRFEAEPARYMPARSPSSMPASAFQQPSVPPRVLRDAADGAPVELADARRRFRVSLAFTVLVFALSTSSHLLPEDPAAQLFGAALGWVELALVTPVVLWGGFPVFVRAWRLTRARRPGLLTLAGLAIGLSYAYGALATAAPRILPPALRHDQRYVVLYLEASALVVTLILLRRVLSLRNAAGHRRDHPEATAAVQRGRAS